jgi:hypothetical protein
MGCREIELLYIVHGRFEGYVFVVLVTQYVVSWSRLILHPQCLCYIVALISFIKPKPLPPSAQKGKGKPPVLSISSENGNNSKPTHSSMVQQPQPEQQKGKKPKPTRAQLGQEIGFDLVLTQFSLMIDIVSQTLVILFPAPAFTDDHISLMQTDQQQMSFAKSQALFVAASSLTSFGSGTVPAVHSLALCMLQVRALDDAACSVDGELVKSEEEGTGALFGAFAVLQAVGQMILGVSCLSILDKIELMMTCLFFFFLIFSL